MPVRCLCTALSGAALAVGVLAGAVAPAQAAGQAWTGRYSMVTLASQKGGTSLSARQREPDFSAVFTLSTSCAAVCVATAAGPPSSNPTVPSPPRFIWDGQQWKATYDWAWQCSLDDSTPSEWSPATSFTYYTPQPDGSLRGMWHTDIATGACRGSVVMPVAAVPG
jgi:hypothetical protein